MYSDEKKASAEEDLRYGFQIESTESIIRNRLGSAPESDGKENQTWNHLSPEIFQTPYPELERIVSESDPGNTTSTWADLGAAYGRLGIVLARQRPGAGFFGIEIVPERVAEAKRVYEKLKLDPSSLQCGDLSHLDLPIADFYFIYDFGRHDAIRAVLEKLRAIAKIRRICVIGRGRAVRDLIEQENPWLAHVVPAIHSAHYSIYRSA